MRSASGGAADSAAKNIYCKMGGAVYGAAYDEQLAVSHIEVTDEAEREKLQSSKYVQSDPKDSYAKVKQRLSEGKNGTFYLINRCISCHRTFNELVCLADSVRYLTFN